MSKIFANETPLIFIKVFLSLLKQKCKKDQSLAECVKQPAYNDAKIGNVLIIILGSMQKLGLIKLSLSLNFGFKLNLKPSFSLLFVQIHDNLR